MIELKSDVNIEEDFLEFFGEKREIILHDILAIEHENDIKSEIFPLEDISHQKLYDIYRSDKSYLWQTKHIGNDWFNGIKTMENGIYFKSAKEFVKKPIEQTSVLDYGCGSGSYGIHMALEGYDVTLADIPHKHFQFIKFLCKKHGVPVKFFDVPCSNTIEFPAKYDYILNAEVMEHCDDPIMVLNSLVDAMVDNGIMFMSVFFDNAGGRDPSHLLKNMKKFNLSWREYVQNIERLKVVYSDVNNVDKVYQKI